MVAIKDMEMPTDCYSCFLSASDCPVLMFRHDKRADGCPLVEIEEHKVEKLEQIIEDYGLSEKDLTSEDLTDFEKDIIREILDKE